MICLSLFPLEVKGHCSRNQISTGRLFRKKEIFLFLMTENGHCLGITTELSLIWRRHFPLCLLCHCSWVVPFSSCLQKSLIFPNLNLTSGSVLNLSEDDVASPNLIHFLFTISTELLFRSTQSWTIYTKQSTAILVIRKLPLDNTHLSVL